MATTIQSLPPEILCRILKIPYLQRHRLASFSLVARSWREPAQALLWKRIRVHQEEVAKKRMASEAYGCYPCMFLTITVEARLGLAIRDRFAQNGSIRSLCLSGSCDVEFFSCPGIACTSISTTEEPGARCSHLVNSPPSPQPLDRGHRCEIGRAHV